MPENNQTRGDTHLHTSWNSPVVETCIADSHRREAPAPLGDRPGFGGAGVAEALAARTAVVLGVVGLKFLSTFMAFLRHKRKINK